MSVLGFVQRGVEMGGKVGGLNMGRLVFETINGADFMIGTGRCDGALRLPAQDGCKRGGERECRKGFV